MTEFKKSDKVLAELEAANELLDHIVHWGFPRALPGGVKGCDLRQRWKNLRFAREAANKPKSEAHDIYSAGPLFTTRLMGRSVSEWGEILNYARLHGWGPPKLKEGQEVWVRCELVSVYQEDGACVRPLRKLPVRSETDRILAAARMRVHPDDIRTEEP